MHGFTNPWFERFAYIKPALGFGTGLLIQLAIPAAHASTIALHPLWSLMAPNAKVYSPA